MREPVLQLSGPITGYWLSLLMPEPLTAMDILIPRGQFLFSQEQRAAQVKTSKLNGEICHLFRPQSAIEEEGRGLLHLLFSLLDRSFRLLTKCYLAYCKSGRERALYLLFTAALLIS